MAIKISLLKIIFFNQILYQNWVTDNAAECRYGNSILLDNVAHYQKDVAPNQKTYSQVLVDLKQLSNIPLNNLIEFKINIWKLDSWDQEGIDIYAITSQLNHQDWVWMVIFRQKQQIL